MTLDNSCRAASTGVAMLFMALNGSPVGATEPRLSFDRVFTAANEAPSLHYKVLFRGASGVHQMEAWRDGDRRVKRVTDKAIVSLATHRPGDPGYQLTVIDLKRRIATKIDRTNLYRVGNFTDWFDLGHGLRHPKGKYTLTVSTAPPGIPKSIAACAWYRLTDGARATSICWDVRDRLPLLLVASDNQLLWRVIHVDTKPSTAAIFAIDIRGFTVNDANRDIDQD